MPLYVYFFVCVIRDMPNYCAQNFHLARFLILSCQRCSTVSRSFSSWKMKRKKKPLSKLQLEAKLICEKVTLFPLDVVMRWSTDTYSFLWIANQFRRMQIILINTGRTWIAISEKRTKKKKKTHTHITNDCKITIRPQNKHHNSYHTKDRNNNK